MKNHFKQFIFGLREGMELFGQYITVLINSALLFFVYIVGAGLTSIVARILKKHFLEIDFDKNKKSYWNELDLNKKPIEEYYRQF